MVIASDLAKLYQCTNVAKDIINQAVKRNLLRFSDDFYFQLTKEDFFYLRSQFGTSSWNQYGGVRKLPYVFTEQRVAMLATVLRTDVATKVSIVIMRVFVAMRKYISKDLIQQKYINDMVLEDHNKIKVLEESFNKLEEKKKINEIYFDGQIYDAYFKIQEIFKEAKKELIIIDGYKLFTTVGQV